MNNNHHSLSDWDYRDGAKLELSADKYISAPTALRTQNIDEGIIYEHCYLGDVLGHNIPEGRLITWYYSKDAVRFHAQFLFRCQEINYLDHPDHCYTVDIRKDTVILTRYDLGEEGWYKALSFSPDLITTQWYHLRLTFFEYDEGNLAKYLRTIVEVEVSGEWVEIFNWGEPGNNWAESDVNRLGFRLRARPDPSYNYIDDTQILRKP